MMRFGKIHESGGERTFAVVFDTDDEVMAGLLQFAREQHLSGARLSAIGAFRSAMLGYFDLTVKDYEKIPITGQVEVLSLLGDIALKDDEPVIHAHVVVGRRDGLTMGGHLLEARVRPTLEVIVVESPTHLRKVHDPATGLALLRF